MATPSFLGLKHAALECTDLARSIAFYRRVGFDPYYVESRDWAMLQCHDTYLSLVPVPAVAAPSPARGSHQAHLGLLLASREAVDDLFASLGDVKKSRVENHRDGSYGFYCADPDGHSIECIFIPHRSQHAPVDGEAWVLLAHGSRDARWGVPFEKLADVLRAHVPSVPVHLCYLESAPGFEETVDAVAKTGVKTVRVFPLFLSGGGAHMGRDIPALVSAARAKYPALHLPCASALGESFLVQQALVAAIVRAAEAP